MAMIENRVFVNDGEINPDLVDGKHQVYIWSTDMDAKCSLFTLLQHKVPVSGFIAKEQTGQLYSLPIFLQDEVEEENSIYVISQNNLEMARDSVEEEKLYFMDSPEIEKKEFIFKENGEFRKCNAALMLTMILSRIKGKKAIFLVSSDYLAFWNNLAFVLRRAMTDVSIISVDQEFEKIYDYLYYDADELIFFIATFDYTESVQTLKELGFKETQHYVYIHNSFSGHITNKYYGYDWYLGNTFIEDKEFPGFFIHGNLHHAQKKIVILGNSVTDPLFYPQKSWPEMFWEKCREHSENIVLFNGAITDYNSSNEVIKLFRDVLILEPDIVVSYSGCIDFREYVPDFPYINLNLMRTSQKWQDDCKKEVIYGLPDRRSAYDRWISNEKIMYQICRLHNICFYGVLQPWIGSECENPCEKLQVWRDNYWSVSFPQFAKLLSNAKEFKSRIKADIEQYNWMFDFTGIFSEIEDSDIFFDSIHVNERGNQIISERVGNLLGLF